MVCCLIIKSEFCLSWLASFILQELLNKHVIILIIDVLTFCTAHRLPRSFCLTTQIVVTIHARCCVCTVTILFKNHALEDSRGHVHGYYIDTVEYIMLIRCSQYNDSRQIKH